MQYFRPYEFLCHCGCEDNAMAPQFVSILNDIRDRVAAPLIVTSGKRCIAHDNLLGGARAHTTGKAADLLCHGELAYKVVSCAADLGITGIGVSQRGPIDSRFIHLDTLQASERRPRPWVWTY